MKLYINTKKITFDEDTIEHEIVLNVAFKRGICKVVEIDLPKDNQFVIDTLKTIFKKDKTGEKTKEIKNQYFVIREQNTWHGFPLYEIVNGKIIKFDYTKYAYFADTDRRKEMSKYISKMYNQSSEAKITRKTLKIILDHLEIIDEKFEKYNTKVEEFIAENPKNNN